MAKRPLEEIKAAQCLEVKTRFTGSLKKSIEKDMERGYKPADLMRQMARFFYDTKGNHSY